MKALAILLAVVAPMVLPMRPEAFRQHFNTQTQPLLLAGPMKQVDTHLEEAFPQISTTRFNYLCSPVNHANLSKYATISVTMGEATVSGTPVFPWLSPTNKWVDGCDPVSARPMLWVRNTNLSDTTNRWWSSDHFVLAPGQVTLTIPLDGSHWTGVYGQKAGPKFAENVVAECITFGGGWFKGHGAYTTGGIANFQLFDYRLN